jgi:hypothetical protein
MLKEMLLKLYFAKDADELHRIVMSDSTLAKPTNWKPYGGIPNNCGTFEGQQANPEAALIEKITNSIDAILMKECMIRGLNPKDSVNPEIPSTMCEAIEKFFNITKGKWENAGEQRRREIAKSVQLIVDGDKQIPNITVYDNGEGQNPTNFESTFLSLLRDNKISIPFVQGKFNMGSTGAVLFCGGNRYQLIISRRSLSLKDRDGKIGFTLVRKHILTDDEETSKKSTWYEYFTIEGDIPSFECDELDLGLYETPFVDGSIVKMYSYELSRGCQSDATLDLWRELNVLLYEASIPVLIWEKRENFKGHSKTKIMLGNKTRISIDERNKRYATLAFSINDLTTFGAEIPIEVTIFNPEVENKEFIRRKPVVYLVNGQVQGNETRSFISSELGLRQLRDNILISVDCTGIKTSVRNDLFMSCRDRVRQGKYYEKINEGLIYLLKQDENLRRINQEFKGKILRECKDDNELIENLFLTFKNNKDIRDLFIGHSGELSFLTKEGKEHYNDAHKKEEKKERKELKRFPSIFKAIGLEEKEGRAYKAIPKGGRGIIKFETDVEDEYFTRNIDKGGIEICILDYGNGKPEHGSGIRYPSTIKDVIKVHRAGPFNGEIKLVIEPEEYVNVGDIFPLSVKLLSPSGDIEVIIFVKIETEQIKNVTLKREEEPDLNLPRAIRVFEHNQDESVLSWNDCEMDGNDVVKFVIGDSNVVEEIRINMDSNIMKREINKQGVNVEVIGKRYFASVYAHSLLLYSTLMGYYSQSDLDYDAMEIKENLDAALEFVFKYYGSFLMSFDSIMINAS